MGNVLIIIKTKKVNDSSIKYNVNYLLKGLKEILNEGINKFIYDIYYYINYKVFVDY